MNTIRHARRALGPLGIVLVLAAAAPAAATAAAAARFGVDRDAGVELDALWAESIAAHEERVACMAAERRGDGWAITAIRELPHGGADSASIGSSASLRECRPPEWVGTVHTHIAKFNGLPFTTFSASDRQVMRLWRKRWETEGVFCVVYSETMAHCEGDGDDSDDMAYSASTPARVVPQRGNVIFGSR